MKRPLMVTGLSRPRAFEARETDWRLLVATFLFGSVVLLALYGPVVAPHDVYFTRALVNGAAPPFPPSSEFPLGSDVVGHDRFSWFLIGARGTVVIALAAGLLRLGLGASLGVYAAAAPGWIATVLRRLALGLSSVPATIAAILAVLALGTQPHHFVLAFGLVGWAEPFHLARRSAQLEGRRGFVEAARSVGVSKARLLLRHLLPNLAPTFLTVATFQVSAVLLLMAELALLNLFAGGTTVVDFDRLGRAIPAPAEPNWASMLATTRPIITLYGDVAAVLIPGVALLVSVLATNLLGDAFAARAQRLDLYRLLTRRQLLGLAAAAILMSAPVALWPSRLVAELDYGEGFPTATAHALARELAAPPLRERPSGSEATREVAMLLSERLGGHVVRGVAETREISRLQVSIGSVDVPAGGVVALSIDDAAVSGPLIYVHTGALFSRTDSLNGAIVAVHASTPTSLANLVQRASGLGARGVVALIGTTTEYRGASDFYALPVVRMTPSALASALHRSLPSLEGSQLVPVGADATLLIETTQRRSELIDVVAQVTTSSAQAPVAVVVAPFDDATASAPWSSATAAGLLVGVVEHIRSSPLDLEVIAIATSGDDQGFAGLRLALGTLRPDQIRRLRALLVIGPVLSEHLGVQAQTDFTVTSGTARLAARLRDAAGIGLEARPAGELLRAIQTTGVAAAPLVFSALGASQDPGPAAFARAGRVVLAALAYIPRHIDEMQ